MNNNPKLFQVLYNNCNRTEEIAGTVGYLVIPPTCCEACGESVTNGTVWTHGVDRVSLMSFNCTGFPVSESEFQNVIGTVVDADLRRLVQTGDWVAPAFWRVGFHPEREVFFPTGGFARMLVSGELRARLLEIAPEFVHFDQVLISDEVERRYFNVHFNYFIGSTEWTSCSICKSQNETNYDRIWPASREICQPPLLFCAEGVAGFVATEECVRLFRDYKSEFSFRSFELANYSNDKLSWHRRNWVR